MFAGVSWAFSALYEWDAAFAIDRSSGCLLRFSSVLKILLVAHSMAMNQVFKGLFVFCLIFEVVLVDRGFGISFFLQMFADFLLSPLWVICGAAGSNFN